ncbi:histone-lysine N-methyltransferase, H3 lysine-79 specific-like isoform X7 [Dermacentor silvarum]|nr:histone-lysine N-methyltransferase, H3 lysine-79 specific-like isoform X6 [Dermacentor silvarum]XP_049521619.1 histone-lysine N-methyltransferase, H3 lysine-79 specific-like isoform X7 [Dermacentor silvarum]
MSSIGSVGRNGGLLANGMPSSTVGNGGVKKDNSAPAMAAAAANGGTANGPLLETTTVKKGLLWQQWDKFFSRWKERYFVLTKDYLACFKKESKVGTSEMGGFLYKVNLADVEGLQWADKKRTGVIALRVGTEGQLLLWTNCGLDDWMFALRDAIGRSKGRREALRKAHTLGPQFYDAGLTKRQALLLQHTLTSSEAQSPSSSVRTSTSCELRSLGERTPTPSLTRRAQRMSVATEASDSGCSMAQPPGSASVDYDTRSVPWSAPLGPRPTGSYSSLISLGQRSLGAHRPSPRSLQVSPALAQRSLYAQHVLNSPEVANGRNGGVRCGGVGGATASATLEFAYIRPDSPVTLTGPRRSTLDSGHCQRSQSSCFGGASPFLQLGEPQQQQQQYHKLLQQQQQRHHRNHKHHQNHHPAAPPFALHDLRAALPGQDDEPRPSSIYGQPSLTVVGDRAAYSVQPPDVVPNNHASRPSASKLMKRAVRAYTHSKSDSSFVLKQSPSQLQGHLAVT